MLVKNCKFRPSSTQFLDMGHVIDQKGVCLDLEEVSAVFKPKAPANATELLKFTGIVSQLKKIFPKFGYYHPSPLRIAEHQGIMGLGRRTSSLVESRRT